MDKEGITYKDVNEYEKFFNLTPPFLLERFAKKNTNLVLKFESKVKIYMDNLNDHQKKKLEFLLSSNIDDLQRVMDDAYRRYGKKQYKILANPKYKEFIKINLNEVSKMIK
ncbi:hypothetical protein [Methanobrevibacter sp.]|uniref:hypothetical protein n=1 Tax=Methanobrevibacter sp. TaxID=66852 RepID=UPI003870E272